MGSQGNGLRRLYSFGCIRLLFKIGNVPPTSIVATRSSHWSIGKANLFQGVLAKGENSSIIATSSHTPNKTLAELVVHKQTRHTDIQTSMFGGLDISLHHDRLYDALTASFGLTTLSHEVTCH